MSMKIFVVSKLTYDTEYHYDEYSEPSIAFKSENDAIEWVKEQTKLNIWHSYSINEIDLK